MSLFRFSGKDLHGSDSFSEGNLFSDDIREPALGPQVESELGSEGTDIRDETGGQKSISDDSKGLSLQDLNGVSPSLVFAGKSVDQLDSGREFVFATHGVGFYSSFLSLSFVQQSLESVDFLVKDSDSLFDDCEIFLLLLEVFSSLVSSLHDGLDFLEDSIVSNDGDTP